MVRAGLADPGTMRQLHPQLPKGARVYLPDEAARKRHVEARLLDVFTRWGYREIVTSTFEYADVLAMGTDESVQENMFKLVDRETGRMLALRADITPQIARIVATRLRDEPKPVRLSYVTNVFRYDEPKVAHYREFYQAGVELIGLEKPEAEAEIIAMAIEGLRALGLERFQIDLGHPDFFRGLCEGAGAEPGRVRELRAALARKDASALERTVTDLAPAAHVGEALLALPSLFGHEAVLDRAAGFARNKRSAKALANLAEVYRLLTIYGLADAALLDLGEVRGFDYYSGTYFEAYVSGFGASVAAGGRYDHMLARFGYDCAAVGFAFDVARVLSVMEAQGIAVALSGPDVFIIDFTRDKTAALSLARRLRDTGASVARDIISRGLEESVDYARAQRVRHVLVVGSPRTQREKYVLHTIPSGILHPGCRCVIGCGVVVDPGSLIEEMESLVQRGVTLDGNLFISKNAHLIMPYHPALDRASEAKLGKRRIGTTGKGVGPAYVDKAARVGIRMADLLNEPLFREKLELNAAQKNRLFREIYDAQTFTVEEILDKYLRYAGWLAPYITDTALLLSRWIEAGYSVLFEGAQATMLDIDHGTYPYITSSSTTAGGAATGTGVPPTKIHGVVGVSKAYTTRVGAGPFPTEMTGAIAETIRARGHEYGATTGRPRRCGWFDAVVGRYATRINGLDTVALTKLDVLDQCETLKVCVAYRHRGER